MSDDPVLAALARLEEGQAGLREELGSLREGQAKLREEQTKLRVDLMERMDRFENRLTTIQDDIGVNMGGVSTVFERQAATRKEVESQGSLLQGMIRQIQRLQTDVEALKKRSA